MMILREQILEAQKKAMKEKEAEKLSILRVLWATIKNEEIEKGQPLNNEQIQELVARQVKQLKDALVDFEKGNRTDLIEQTKKEIAVLTVYLPEQMSDVDLEQLIKNILLENNITDAKDSGKAMALIMPAVKGKTDGAKVRNIVNQILNA
ncbi:MAG TPA: GatB/YqeY domain-containing protein [Candidatus Magasanikbacteria bacterium]|jgi:uncharacterized protein YqeY|nr:GatB/YqeY domain-containing protein [Candidatus Magasanikbacteria bacterium]HQF56886.1 GatB/YqeY domain-containing protein [Candidatus Magasanikbacteria bacterium]HQL52995.1 GatB/YqeY domain-containing protein [Candidatus Magasanikbacteria bacterium]